MKDQKHNEGTLVELNVSIEQSLREDLKKMSQNSELSEDEIVAIALKRFKSSHADYMGIKIEFP